MIFNANRDPNKSNVWDWTDVFPEWEEPAREMDDEEMFANMLMWSKLPASRN